MTTTATTTTNASDSPTQRPTRPATAPCPDASRIRLQRALSMRQRIGDLKNDVRALVNDAGSPSCSAEERALDDLACLYHELSTAEDYAVTLIEDATAVVEYADASGPAHATVRIPRAPGVPAGFAADGPALSIRNTDGSHCDYRVDELTDDQVESAVAVLSMDLNEGIYRRFNRALQDLPALHTDRDLLEAICAESDEPIRI